MLVTFIGLQVLNSSEYANMSFLGKKNGPLSENDMYVNTVNVMWKGIHLKSKHYHEFASP